MFSIPVRFALFSNDMISSNGNDVTNKAIEYLKPLIQGELTIKYKNGIPLHLDLFK